MTPPVLKTKRLILRLPEKSDVTSILNYFKENETRFASTDPPKPEGFHTESYWLDRIQSAHIEFEGEQTLRLFLFDSLTNSSVVGTITFTQMFRGPFHACNLGYAIDGKNEGKGLMTEALQVAIEYVFETLNFHRIMANHLLENERSARLLKRLGFIIEGTAMNYLFINGKWRDHILNSLTNEKWMEHGKIFDGKLYAKISNDRKVSDGFYKGMVVEESINNKFFTIQKIQKNKGNICDLILRALPDWFGIEQAIVEYIKSVESLTTFVAFSEDKPIGILSIKFHNNYTADIYLMAVLKEFHGQGVGKALLVAVEKYSRDSGTEYLMVKTLGPSRPNKYYDKTRGFYLSCGFRPLEEFKTIWNETNPCLIMVKRI